MDNSEVSRFHVVDYIVFCGMLVVSLGIGLYQGCKGDRQRTTQQYLMADRKLQLIPATLSIAVSWVSGNTLLGVPAEAYMYGAQYDLIGVGSIIATTIIAFVFVPLFYPLRLTSTYQYLEMRYNSKSVKLLGTALLSIMQILYVGTVIFGPATALEIATGMPTWGSLVMVGTIGTLYTAVGGLKAAVWTDAFQACVMIFGMVTVIIVGCALVGGPEEVWQINMNWGRLYVEYSPDPTERLTIWSLCFGSIVFFVGIFGVNQPFVQRVSALPHMSTARWAMLMNGPFFLLFTSVAIGAGMVAFAYFTQRGCDPARAGYISNNNQILAYYVMEVLGYPGIPGIYFACLFSGALRYVLHDGAALFGALCLSVSFVLMYVGGTLIQVSLSINGACLGPLLGLFVLGALFPWANWKGALIGGFLAMVTNLWMLIGQTLHKTQTQTLPSTIQSCPHYNTTPATILVSSLDPHGLDATTGANLHQTENVSGLEIFYSIAFLWYPLIGCTIVLVFGVIFSFITGATDVSEIHPALLFPCVRSMGRYKDRYHEHELEIFNTGDEKERKPRKQTITY